MLLCLTFRIKGMVGISRQVVTGGGSATRLLSRVGGGHEGISREPKCWVTPQVLNQRSNRPEMNQEEVVPKMTHWRVSDAGQYRRRWVRL